MLNRQESSTKSPEDIKQRKQIKHLLLSARAGDAIRLAERCFPGCFDGSAHAELLKIELQIVELLEMIDSAKREDSEESAAKGKDSEESAAEEKDSEESVVKGEDSEESAAADVKGKDSEESAAAALELRKIVDFARPLSSAVSRLLEAFGTDKSTGGIAGKCATVGQSLRLACGGLSALRDLRESKEAAYLLSWAAYERRRLCLRLNARLLSCAVAVV